MKRLLHFTRMSLVGGVLFLMPIVVLAFILGKAFGIAHKIVLPLAAHLPVESIIGLETPRLLAIVLLLLFCFLAGVFARTARARRIVNWLETALLSNLPGYEFIKSISENFLASDNANAYPVVLARIEDSWQLGFLIERLEGGLFAVFVPGTPSPQSGSVYFMTEDRFRLTDLPATPVLKCLKRYGLGSNALLSRLPTLAADSGAKPAPAWRTPEKHFLKTATQSRNLEPIPKTMKYITPLILSGALLGLGASARADILELKNGNVLNGKYSGGTAGTVRFDAGAGMQVIETSQVIALTFTTAPAQRRQRLRRMLRLLRPRPSRPPVR